MSFVTVFWSRACPHLIRCERTPCLLLRTDPLMGPCFVSTQSTRAAAAERLRRRQADSDALSHRLFEWREAPFDSVRDHRARFEVLVVALQLLHLASVHLPEQVDRGRDRVEDSERVFACAVAELAPFGFDVGRRHVGEPAGDDLVEPGLGLLFDVQAEAVQRDPSPDVNADRADLGRRRGKDARVFERIDRDSETFGEILEEAFEVVDVAARRELERSQAKVSATRRSNRAPCRRT